MLSVNHRKVAIIGAGPAGVAAAIQLKRYGIDFFLFERKKIGGLLHNANLVENFLGFPSGIKGIEVCQKLEEHLRILNISSISENVKEISYINNQYHIKSDKEYLSDFIILATGTKPVVPEFMTSELLSCEKVFFEVADFQNIYDSEFIIIGGGDAAFDYALNLAQNKNKIKILCRNGMDKALPLLVKRAEINIDIKIIPYTHVLEIILKSNQTEIYCSKGKLLADYVLVATGRKPDLSIISKTDNFDDEINKTFFLAGDVRNGLFRQTAIATGDGLRAAMEIYKKINEII